MPPARVRGAAPPPAVAMATGSPGPDTPARALVARNSPGPHARLASLTFPGDTDPGLLEWRFKHALKTPRPGAHAHTHTLRRRQGRTPGAAPFKFRPSRRARC